MHNMASLLKEEQINKQKPLKGKKGLKTNGDEESCSQA